MTIQITDYLTNVYYFSYATTINPDSFKILDKLEAVQIIFSFLQRTFFLRLIYLSCQATNGIPGRKVLMAFLHDDDHNDDDDGTSFSRSLNILPGSLCGCQMIAIVSNVVINTYLQRMPTIFNTHRMEAQEKEMEMITQSAAAAAAAPELRMLIETGVDSDI